MLQTGIVQRIQPNNTAEVKIIRQSSCGDNCASCGLCPNRTSLVEAANDIHAAVGDTVIIDMTDKKILGAAFLVYIVPLIMLIAGYCIGDIFFSREAFRILTGFAIMGISFMIIILIDKKMKHQYTHQIVKIINSLD